AVPTPPVDVLCGHFGHLGTGRGEQVSGTLGHLSRSILRDCGRSSLGPARAWRQNWIGKVNNPWYPPRHGANRMSIPARLGLVTLGTVDFDRLRAYYVALGWPIAVEEKDFCLFHTAGALLALYPRRELSQEAGGGPQAAGGSPLHEPRAMFWGGYSCYFADPEGNAWEVAHNPHWTLDDRGMPVPPA